MKYKKLTKDDYIEMATQEEFNRLNNIFDIHLIKVLAVRWCSNYAYNLGGYLGNGCWDAGVYK